jgi:hypothetical protein
MIDSMEANIGDCCYFLVPNERQPRSGTIVSIILNESAIQVMDPLRGGFYIVWENNAAWNEKELKGQKWEKPHNYLRDIPEDQNAKESDERECDVHHRPKRKPKTKRPKKRNSSVSKCSASKQKTVRSTRRSNSQTGGNRKSGRKQK